MRVVLAALVAMAGVLLPTAPAQAAAQAVMMEGYAYSPSTLTVRVGDTVTWTNHDQAPHDVVTTSAPVAIRSSMLSHGQSWSYTFTTAGTYSYYCSVHPDMRAQIVVQPAPAPASPTTTRPKTTRSSSAAAAHAAPMPSMSTPLPSAAEPPVEAAPPTVPQQVVAAPVTPSSTTTLDPMLIVAAVAAGTAVLCLLLLASRRET